MIHLINMTTTDKQEFEMIYPMVSGSPFDVRMQTHHMRAEENLNALLKEMDENESEFLDTQVVQVRGKFFQDMYKQDYGKFKYDQEFMSEFYEFIYSYTKNI